MLPSENGVQQFIHEVEKETFEGLIWERVEGTVQKTASLFKEAQDRGHEVETVVLMGRASHIPLVIPSR